MLCDMNVALRGPSDPEMGAPKVRVDVTETHMADKRALDDLLDEFWGLLRSVLSRRSFFWLSFGVGFLEIMGGMASKLTFRWWFLSVANRLNSSGLSH